ncbi:MAG: hypothetical protein PHE48_02555 [Candidatus Daviesbacteria bacterium]|nr:hypothetical protein [Candidatus Daviesbacteria bacterium]
MVETSSNASLLDIVTRRIRGEAAVLRGRPFVKNIDPKQILFPTVVMEQGTETTPALQKMEGLGGLPVIIVTDCPESVSGLVIAKVRYHSVWDTNKSLFLNIRQVLPNWNSSVILPIPEEVEDSNKLFLLPGISESELRNPPGISIRTSNSPPIDAIRLGSNDVLLMVDDPKNKCLYIGPLSLPARWREVVSNGRLVNPADLMKETNTQETPKTTVDTPQAVLDELRDRIQTYPVRPVRNEMAAGEETRRAVFPLEGTWIPVDIRLLQNGEIELKFAGFDLAEFARQCDQKSESMRLGKCFTPEETKDNLYLTIAVRQTTGDSKPRIAVVVEVTKFHTGYMEEVDAWPYLGHGKHQRSTDLVNLHNAFSNPDFLANVLSSLQAPGTKTAGDGDIKNDYPFYKAHREGTKQNTKTAHNKTSWRNRMRESNRKAMQELLELRERENRERRDSDQEIP